MTIRITCLRLQRRAVRLMRVAAACFIGAGAASAQDAASSGQGALPGAQMAIEALMLLGVPYRYGGQDPARGLDCSGLVRHVAQSVLKLDLPRTSEAMARIGEAVARDALQVGDLVFFNTRGRRYSHVGIYVGDGQFVHAPTQRGKVRVETVSASYWARRFNGARRLPPTAAAATTEAPGAGLTDLVPEPSPSAPAYGDPTGGA
jgi:hypothetical protein